MSTRNKPFSSLRSHAFSAVLGTCGLASSAWALQPPSQTFELWNAGGANLVSGQSHAGAFDIGLFFTPGQDHLSPASITLNFVGSDARTFVTEESVVVQASPVVTRDTTRSYNDTLDTIKVMLLNKGGPIAFVDDAALFYELQTLTGETPVKVYIPVTCSGGFVPSCSGGYYVEAGRDRAYDKTIGYKGSFSYSTLLDAQTLAALASTGRLAYGFTVLGGGVALESAVLRFGVSSVPEPGTVALALSGLALAFWSVWRRRISRAPGKTR